MLNKRQTHWTGSGSWDLHILQVFRREQFSLGQRFVHILNEWALGPAAIDQSSRGPRRQAVPTPIRSTAGCASHPEDQDAFFPLAECLAMRALLQVAGSSLLDNSGPFQIFVAIHISDLCALLPVQRFQTHRTRNSHCLGVLF